MALLAEYLPGPGQTLADRPLDDGLQQVQAARFVCSGRLEARADTASLSIDEALEERDYAYHGPDAHAMERDRGADENLLQALEARINVFSD